MTDETKTIHMRFEDLTVGPDAIVIRKNKRSKAWAFLPFGISFLGLMIVTGVVPYARASEGMRIFLLLFLCIWVGFTIVAGFLMIEGAWSAIIIDEEGVLQKGVFRKKRLNWSEIRYWGLILTKSDRQKLVPVDYHLYFNKKGLPKTWLNPTMLSADIEQHVHLEDRVYYMEHVIPFCKTYADTEPDLREIDVWY